MRRMCNKNMRKSNLKLIVLIVALAIAVMAGFGTAAYAASGSNPGIQLQDDRGIFDPFTLNTILISVTGSGSDAVVSSVVTRPPIRIPIRPALRSYFRPPLVQIP